jgi:hypothetical protein
MAIAKCSCGFSKKISDEHIGKKAACLKCKKTITVAAEKEQPGSAKPTTPVKASPRPGAKNKLGVEAKGFVLASLLASHMFFKEQCSGREEFLTTIQQVHSLDDVKKQLLLDKSFADIPDQEDIFKKAVGLLTSIYSSKGQGIETQLFAVVKKLAGGISNDIQEAAFDLAKRVALADGNISVNEQNFLNQIERLLNLSPATPSEPAVTTPDSGTPPLPEEHTPSKTPKIAGKLVDSISTAFSFIIGRSIGFLFKTFSYLPTEAKVIIIVVLAGIAGFVAFTTLYPVFNKVTISTQVKATFKGYEKIDKLYTSFTVVPLIKKSFSSDNLGTYWQKSIAERQLASSGKTMNGYIIADYNMAIGYDNVSEIIEEYIGKECPASPDTLPPPEILSIKADVYPAEGNAASIQDKMYITKSNEANFKNELIQELKNNGQWKQLTGRGKNVLNTYISIYCKGEE